MHFVKECHKQCPQNAPLDLKYYLYFVSAFTYILLLDLPFKKKKKRYPQKISYNKFTKKEKEVFVAIYYALI